MEGGGNHPLLSNARDNQTLSIPGMPACDGSGRVNGDTAAVAAAAAANGGDDVKLTSEEP